MALEDKNGQIFSGGIKLALFFGFLTVNNSRNLLKGVTN